MKGLKKKKKRIWEKRFEGNGWNNNNNNNWEVIPPIFDINIINAKGINDFPPACL